MNQVTVPGYTHNSLPSCTALAEMSSTAPDKIQGDQCRDGQAVKDGVGQAEPRGVSQELMSREDQTVLYGTVKVEQCGTSQSEISLTATDKFQGDQYGDDQANKDGADQCINVAVQAVKMEVVPAVHHEACQTVQSGEIQATQSGFIQESHHRKVQDNQSVKVCIG